EQLGGLRVEATGGVVAGIIDRLGHRGAAAKAFAQAPLTLGAGIGLGREAGCLLEQAVEMKAAEAGGPGERVEARWLLRLGDAPAGLGHRCGVWARTGRSVLRPAALAGPKAGGFRLGRGREEAGVRALGLARRAGRAAI